jgi:PLD-like domain
MPDVIAENGRDRQHRLRLRHLLESTNGPVQIASAYVTDRELLLGTPGREVRLVTSLLAMVIASGATSLETLGALIDAGVKCRFVPDRPRLHAKVYVFGNKAAVVSSANLTENALDSNIEVGVELDGENVNALMQWYDQLWATARPIRPQQLADLRQRAAKLRREYVKLKKKSNAVLTVSSKKPATGVFSDDVMSLFDKAKQFFVCNTDRRHRERTATGGHLLEEEMYNRGYATAWESFKFPGHMEQVQAGDAIFMFAKDVGMIGIGRAKGHCEQLPPADAGRVYNGRYKQDVDWRVPVHWLDWRDQEDAYAWQSPNFTFWNVSDESYSDLREGVREHFLRQ